MALNNKSILVSAKKIRRMMKKSNLRAKATKRFKVTTLSDHKMSVAKNILNREFEVSGPNQKWIQDITIIYTQEGWLYLAIVLDLFARGIVGWSMDARMGKELVIEAFRMAVWKRKPPPGGIAHSDQGSQNCSKAYQAELQKYGMISSISRKGDCWDNAPAESFFHTRKAELMSGEKIFGYIEMWYNNKRLHSSNGQVSPAALECKAELFVSCDAQQIKGAKKAGLKVQTIL